MRTREIAQKTLEMVEGSLTTSKGFSASESAKWRVKIEMADSVDDLRVIINELNQKISIGNVVDIVLMDMDKAKRMADFQEKIKEYANKRDLIQKFIKVIPVFYDKSKNWWVWNHEEFMWELVDETDIINAINTKTTLNTLNSREKNELLEGLKQEGRLNKPKDLPKNWVQFKDQLIDISTGNITVSTPEYFATNPIQVKVGESEETPVMDQIFEEWVGKEYVQTLYEIISYCLLPDYPLSRIFCFIGSGMNGKSKYLELISKFIGVKNITSTELDTLLDSRFEITRTYKKLVCQLGETNFNEMKKTSILKKLTGGDLIGYEYKGKDPFHDYNYSKILISTNNLPTTTDKTIGFYRRWLIIDFPNQFSEKKNILDAIPQEEYENLAKKSIRILKELLEKREFHNEGTIEERTKRFEDRSNPLEKFFKEMVVDDFDGYIPKFEFKKELDSWCEQNNFRKISDRIISHKMSDIDVQTIKVDASWTTNEGLKPRIRAWGGISWKTPVQDVQEVHPISVDSTRIGPSGKWVDKVDKSDIKEEWVKDG